MRALFELAATIYWIGAICFICYAGSKAFVKEHLNPKPLKLPPPEPAIAHAPPDEIVPQMSVEPTDDQRLAHAWDEHDAEEEDRLEREQYLKTVRNSAGYKHAFKYGKAAYLNGHSYKEGPHFKANPNERMGWAAGWSFAADEAVRAGGRNFGKLINN